MAGAEKDIALSKGRFIRFNPTINSGHILTASSVIIASALAWAQLRTDVSSLLESDKERKLEIIGIEGKRESDRIDLFQKLATNQTAVHDELKDLRLDFSQRFDRLEDKIDRKEDKHVR